MLLELRVENYAVIDQVAVEFAPGLNLLTGETGAGKSILINALSLLLGEKASTEMIRHGAEKAVVSGVFEVDSRAVARILDEHGIEAEGPQVIVRREVAGKGRVFINNQPATVAVLREMAPELASIHAQNESILSFDARSRRGLLDAFAGLSSEATAAAFERWKQIQERMAELEQNEQDRLRLVDLWSFQKKEIEQGRLEPAEDERLESEKRVLANAERIHAAATAAYDALYDGASSAAVGLRAALRHLEELARFQPQFEEMMAALDSARITVEDAGATLRDYAGAVEASPERLAEVEDRLALLDRLKRKYGPRLDDVIAYGEEVSRKLEEVENRDELLRDLRRQLEAAAEEYLQAARALSRKRREAARRLEKQVEREINELAMKAGFKVEVAASEETSAWSAAGIDGVQYLVTTNPGEPLKPVEQIASGGELSRVILALKATVEQASGRPAGKRNAAAQRTLVFDEIDTGIGGRAAEAVGRKLKSLSAGYQVLCITHLPQIASFADHHYAIRKSEVKGRTRVTVERLEESERTEEIARMLSGARLTEASRKHAEQMLRANA